MIVGLVGLAQSGKDTTAEILVRNFGFKQVSFAGPLKQISYDIDPLISDGKHLAELVDEFGWDYTKVNFPECRRFLQRIGTEGMRKNIDDNFWVNIAIDSINKMPNTHVVISDMRFLNEYQRIASAFLAFEAWKIERAGTKQMNHASETEMSTIPANRIIKNDADLVSLEKQVLEIAQSLGL